VSLVELTPVVLVGAVAEVVDGYRDNGFVHRSFDMYDVPRADGSCLACGYARERA
jgi:hypothetical protein